MHVGGASGEESIDLPGVGLRSSAIILMGSGAKSVNLSALLGAIENVFEATIPAGLEIGLFVPVALTILAGYLFNIYRFHIFLDPSRSSSIVVATVV